MAKVRRGVKSRNVEAIMWEPSFVAMSLALGEPLDAVLVALGDRSTREVTELLAALGQGDRRARAQVLARPLAEIAREVSAMEASWP